MNAEGFTLYTFTNGGQPVSCTGPCAGVWHALVLPAGLSAPTGSSGVTGLGTVTVNGVPVVTHLGLPLYTYIGDTAPGDVKGNGINSFGGIWKVVTVAASP